MNNDGRRHATAPSQDPAVIGVVIAGVLVSFTIPGPYDWGATLIGVILLAVLVAYGEMPQGLSIAEVRRAIGLAAAAAFCLLLILGRLLDIVVGSGSDAHHLLSNWPYPSIKRDEDVPDPNSGWQTGLLWLFLFVVLLGAWLVAQQRNRRATKA
jgi:hypothetical protein